MPEVIHNLEHHIVARDGLRWHVVTAGAFDAPTVLMLHCWSGNWTEWRATMSLLDGQYRFIAVDHLGFGKSDKPDGQHYAIDQQAERTLFLLHHFGYERARVIGHSMGGQIALTLAGTHPEVVERLIVVAPAVTGKMHPFANMLALFLGPARAGFSAHLPLLIKLGGIVPPLGIQAMRGAFPRPAEQRDAALYWLKQITADDQTVSGAQAHLAIRQHDVTPLLANITAPTLAIWGEQDYTVSISELDVLAAHIPQFESLRLPRVGHFPMVEAWREYSSAVTTFL